MEILLDQSFYKQSSANGGAADIILSEYAPLKLFVYANTDSKLERCKHRAAPGEHFTEKEVERRMKQIDKSRARYHDMGTDTAWGMKEGYHLCINTSGMKIKALVPAIAEYVRDFFSENIKLEV